MYKIAFEKRVVRDLKKIPREAVTRILESVEKLSENPFPPACKKLKGRDAWRIRIGDYRVIYGVKSGELMILIIKIGHRKDIYE